MKIPTRTDVEPSLEKEIMKRDSIGLLSHLSQPEQENIVGEISSVLKLYHLPAKKIDDLLWLYSSAPKYAREIIDLGQQVEEVAKKQGLAFKDLILEAVHTNIGIPIAYNNEAPDFKYMIDAIQIIGGYDCSKRNSDAIQKALQTHTQFTGVVDPDCVITCGMKKIKETLGQYIDVSEELSDKIINNKRPMPEHGYSNILDMGPQGLKGLYARHNK